ncbi:DNA polymerase III subunit gamma/tau [Cyclobacterium roseum]|uniref:DNA polymerase III subunit gamma/tau n=1 Tax=Cyclobacterium roseum TaxID=2666137 RepID=UPI001391E2CD|nr:DNA polymerase III subunit gamma/tau [Cyclobacterium roseum]
MKDRPAQQVKQEAPKEAIASRPNESPQRILREEEVKNALEEVKDDFKVGHKNMEMALLQQPFEVKNHQVVFFLQGGLQEDLFPKLKPELTGILRRKLHQPDLEVIFEVKAEAVDPAKSLYTSSEKLSYLLKKSPALKELKNRFGLETDF